MEVETDVGRLTAIGNFRTGSSVIVAARPEHLRLTSDVVGNSAAGRVRSIVFHGSNSLIEVDAGAATPLLAQISNQDGASPKVDEEVRLGWPVAETFAFPSPEPAS